jgi:hypothetical protein
VGGDCALLFSCGYADGALRWQRFASATRRSGPTACADIWRVREPVGATSPSGSARASDVLCVATSNESGMGTSAVGGAQGPLYVATGHFDGRCNLFRVVATKGGSLSSVAGGRDGSGARGLTPLASADLARVLPLLGERELGEVRAAFGEADCCKSGDAHLLFHLGATSGSALAGGPGHLTGASPEVVLTLVGEITDTLLVRIAELVVPPAGPGGCNAATCVAFCVAARLAVVGAVDGAVRIFDARSGRLLRELRPLSLCGGAEADIAALLTLPAPSIVPVQHIAVLRTGHVSIHWLFARHRSGAAAGRAAEPPSASAAAAAAATDKYGSASPLLPCSLLATVSVNGTLIGMQRLRPPSPPRAGRAFAVWATSMVASADGSLLLVGASDGTVSAFHAHTLDPVGFFTLHNEVVEPAAARRPNTAATLVSQGPTFASAAGNFFGIMAHQRSPAPAPLVEAASAAQPPSTGPRCAAVMPPAGAAFLPVTAVTCLYMTDGESMLLAGTADGRVVVVTDYDRGRAREQHARSAIVSSISF